MIKISGCFKLLLIGSSLIFYDKLLFYCDKTLQHMLRKPIRKKLALFSTFHCLFQRLRKCFKLCKLAFICRAYIEIKRFWKFFLSSSEEPTTLLLRTLSRSIQMMTRSFWRSSRELVSSAEAVKSALNTRARQFVQLVWQSSRVKLSNYIFVVILWKIAGRTWKCLSCLILCMKKSVYAKNIHAFFTILVFWNHLRCH